MNFISGYVPSSNVQPKKPIFKGEKGRDVKDYYPATPIFKEKPKKDTFHRHNKK